MGEPMELTGIHIAGFLNIEAMKGKPPKVLWIENGQAVEANGIY